MQITDLPLVKLLQRPAMVLGFILGISMSSLAAALMAEVLYGLEPCMLCIYQRIPFALAIALSAIGLLFRNNQNIRLGAIASSGLLFLINAGIAFYHTGVELKWWRSAVEGCAVPNFGQTDQTILENILSAPTARCDEIPWADPILGLSMANYNVLLGIGMAVICGLSIYLIKTRPSSS